MSFLVELATVCARDLGAMLPVRDVSVIIPQVPSPLALPILIFDSIAVVAVAAILLSFQVRRLHDMNKSGWFVLALFALYALPLPDVDPFPSIAFLIGSMLFAVIPGTAGPNRFGAR